MKTSINNSLPVQDELEFAYRVRLALDERIATMPNNIVDHLSSVRRMAIAHKKPESVSFITESRLAAVHGFTHSLGSSFHWLRRIGMVVPLFILMLGSVGIYYYEQERRIDDLAELDSAVLADELPINAYLDHGFDVYLNKRGE